MFGEPFHQDVILVRDTVLAAALCAKGHSALMLYQDISANFYCAYAITHRLRKDIRLYYGNSLDVDARKLNEELKDIDDYLGDYECWVHAKLRDFDAKQNQG